MLNKNSMKIYNTRMITCDDDLAGHIFVGQEELKVRSIGYCAKLDEDAMHLVIEADVTAHVLDINSIKKSLKGLLDTGAVLSVILIETWTRTGFKKDGWSNRLQITLDCSKQSCTKSIWHDTEDQGTEQRETCG